MLSEEKVRRLSQFLRDDGTLVELKRCPTCGHHVQVPCLFCRARAALAGDVEGKRHRLEPAPKDRLRIELRPKHMLRYRRIHARKLRRRS